MTSGRLLPGIKRRASVIATERNRKRRTNDETHTNTAVPAICDCTQGSEVRSMEGDSASSPSLVNGLDCIVDGWFHERSPLWPGQSTSLQVTSILHHSRSQYQDILIFSSPSHGPVLVLDGAIQLTSFDDYSYQEMISHLPLHACQSVGPLAVLIVGGGDGAVLRRVLSHPFVSHVDLCELDVEVVDLTKEHMPCAAGPSAWADSRTELHVMDGSKFVDSRPETYDVIISDSSDPVGPGLALFTDTFFRSLYRALKPGGVVCCQGGSYWFNSPMIRSIVDSVKTFADTVEYASVGVPTYPGGQIGFIIVTKGMADGKGARIVRRDIANDETRRDDGNMMYYDREMHDAAFVLPKCMRRKIFGGGDEETNTSSSSSVQSDK